MADRRALGVVWAAFTAATVLGQTSTPPGTTPAPTTQPGTSTPPAQPAAPMKPSASQPTVPAGAVPAIIKITPNTPEEPGPFVKRVKPQQWVFRTYISVAGMGELVQEDGTRTSARIGTPFETLTMVFPFVSSCATSVANMDDSTSKLVFDEQDKLSGKYAPGGTLGKPEIIRTQIDGQPYHSGIWLGKWAVGEIGKLSVWESLMLSLDHAMTCYNTVYDEKAAMKVEWPKNGWPVTAASTFGPQMFIDFGPDPLTGYTVPYNPTYVDEIVKKWLAGQDPRSMPPAKLAKLLCGKVAEEFQPVGNGLAFNQDNYKPKPAGTTTNVATSFAVEGLVIAGAEQAARLKRGTEWDMVCLLAAAYRNVGLPARLIIAYDSREEEDNNSSNHQAKLRAWVEWYLYDEIKGQANWVPVDPIRIRKTSSRMQALTQTWRFFGTHDELRGAMPIAFQFHPPTRVRAYSAPAFWGWQVTPGLPTSAWQRIMFSAHKGTVKPEDTKKTGPQQPPKPNQPYRKP